MTSKPVVISVVAVAVIALLLVSVLLKSRRFFPPRAAPRPAPPRRYDVIVTHVFPDRLQSYSGSAVGTPDGEVLGWCGHRAAGGSKSGLVSLRLPDEVLKMIECDGPGPDGFEYASAAYDPASKTFFVFGGWGDAKPTNELFRLNFTRAPAAWERIVAGGVRPSPRNGAPMIFDAPRRRLIVCGGDAGTANSFRPVADCWQFDLATSAWRPLNVRGQPSARWHAAKIADPLHEKAYLFGGAGTGPLDSTLYELDLRTDRWRPLAVTGSPPPSLQGATFTLDPGTGVLVLAGGLRHEPPGPATLSQVWVFDPTVGQWDETDCGEPLRRRDHLAAYSASTGEHLLLGGRISTGVGNFYDRGTLVTRDVRLRIRRASAR